MRNSIFWMTAAMVLLGLLVGCSTQGSLEENSALSEDELKTRAGELARGMLVIDTHVDIPYRLNDEYEDISQRTEGGHFDHPRAKEGGLDAPFMSIYIPATYQDEGGAKEFADELIDMVEGFEEKWPDKYEVARSPDDVERIFKEGKIALPMGMENGAPIEGDMENLHHFKERGIRYITLTHSRVNHISDSSYDLNRKWKASSEMWETSTMTPMPSIRSWRSARLPSSPPIRPAVTSLPTGSAIWVTT